MSHIVEIKTEIRDPVAAAAACRRLHLPNPKQKQHKLYSGVVTGLGIELPGWKYPVVCNTDSGKIKYDNYEGRWGEQHYLDRLLQLYAVEKTKLESRRRGHAVTEQKLTNGSIKLTIHVGGEA